MIEHLLELGEELALSELSSLPSRLDRQVILITQPTWDWESELGQGGLLTLPWHPRGRCGHVERALAEVPIENAC